MERVNFDTYGRIIPKVCIIEVSRYCNFQCFICPHKSMKMEEQGNMSLELFKKIVDDTCQFIEVYQLYWMGEPFLNKSIMEMIHYLREKSTASIMVSTNGSLLTERLCDEILQSGINKIIIDIDTGDSEQIYDSIRIGGNYPKLIKNVKYLISQNKTNKTEIILQFLHLKANTEQLYLFKELWKDTACTLRVDWIDTWANQMPELKDLAVEISPYVNEERKACSDLWFRATINHKGQVNLCCHDYKGLYVFGDLNENSLLDIWNSKSLNELRTQQMRDQFTGLCSNCIEWAKEEEYEEFM